MVKMNMMLHDSIHLTDWFYIYFTENRGMAFGMEIMEKLFLTSFRIIAVGVIIWFLYRCLKKNVKMGFLVCVTLILAGAMGNIIDCVFYGQWFSESTNMSVATFLPEEGGYAPFFYGKVVDMLYFPLIETDWPEWVPFVGGQHFVFFSAIFNFADACISVGIFLLIICYGKYAGEVFEMVKLSPKTIEEQPRENEP
ncbi:MAG: lipoprotein signal peptidase, partial [Bacteroidales bacterium]|nr:lipoprotein signal peptidase [Bacteroidales bacterium]